MRMTLSMICTEQTSSEIGLLVSWPREPLMEETRTGGEMDEAEEDQEVAAVIDVAVAEETEVARSGWTSTDLRPALRTGSSWRTCPLASPGRTSRTS